jgi:adhesin/invasin
VRDDNGDPVSGVAVTLAATGAGNSITQPSATDAGGGTTGSFSSTVAETKTITATADGVTLADQPQITVAAGPVSAARSSVTASPTTIQAGGGSATITVTVRDAHDNPIAGAGVTLAATGSGAVLTQPSGPTDAAGVATGALSATEVGTKTVTATVGTTTITQTASVEVTEQPPPSPLGHTLLTVGSNAANQGTYTTGSIAPAPNALVTVAVVGHRSSGASAPPTITGGGMAQWDVVATATFDAVGSPRKRVTVFRAMSAAPGSGPLTIAFPATQSNSQWIVSQWTGVETGGANGAGAIGQTGAASGDAVNGLVVSLGAFSSPVNLAYGVFGVESSTPAVTPGAGFTAIAEQPSNEGTKSDLFAEWASNDPTVDASWSGLDGAGVAIEIRATAGNLPPSAGFASSCTDRTCSFTSTSSDPDGSITAWDWSFGDGGTATGASTGHTYAADGTYLVELTVTDDAGATSSTSQSVTVAQRVATALAFVTPPSNVESGATITPAVTVEVRDQFGDRLTSATTSVTVAIGTNPAGGTLGGSTTEAAVSGVATFAALTIDQIGDGYTLTATATGLTEAASGPFDVTGPAVSPSLSSVAAVPDAITAGGSGATITVTARDGNGNPISGATVVLAATGGGNTLTQPAAPTDASGVATGSLTSTAAGSKVVSATIDGTAVTGTASVTVTAGAPSSTRSTLTASPGTIAVNGGSAEITVTVLDDYGNPVGGADVVLAATGAGNSLTQPGPSDADGVAIGALGSSVAGDKIVSATVNGTALAATATVQVTDQPPAAIVHTLLTQGFNTTNGNVYTTAAIAPAPNALITVAVLGHRAYGANAPPVLTGGGMTSWDVVGTVVFDPVSGGLKRLTIYRAMSAAPGSGPLTITFESSVSNTQWIVSQWEGVETSGVNGSGAIVQAAADAADDVDALAVVLAPFAADGNVAYGAFGAATNVAAMTPGAAFTLIAQQPSNEGTTGDLLTEWAVGQATVDATWSNLRVGALGVEIRATTGP